MITTQPVETTEQLRQAFGAFPSGVAAICAVVEGQPVGMAASSFTSVSMDPPLVSVCIQKTSTTWPQLRGVTRLGLTVLAEGHDAACKQLAGKAETRFDGIKWEAGPHSSIFIDEATAWFEVSLFDELPGGDHVIALLQVHTLSVAEDTSPLIFHASKFHKLLRIHPDTPKAD